jgi:hypothetical protein
MLLAREDPPRNYAAATAPRPDLLLLKFKTAKARNAVFGARAKLAGTAWGLDEDLTHCSSISARRCSPSSWRRARLASGRGGRAASSSWMAAR